MGTGLSPEPISCPPNNYGHSKDAVLISKVVYNECGFEVISPTSINSFSKYTSSKFLFTNSVHVIIAKAGIDLAGEKLGCLGI